MIFVDELIDEFFPFQLAVAAEVDKQARFHASGLEIVQDLRFLFAGAPVHRFQFDNDLSVADEVGAIPS